jgi:hypothetical protein
MPSDIKITGGSWDRKQGRLFFLVCVNGGYNAAGGVDCLGVYSVSDQQAYSALLPINEWIKGSNVPSEFRLLIDSGAFAIASKAARDTGEPIGMMFGKPLNQINGGAEGLQMYEEAALEIKDKAWGFMEFDLGDWQIKTERREDQEARGICPIPIYSALNDPIDYFQHLLMTYDRVAVGSIARLNRMSKIRLLAALELIYAQSPRKPWVHLLGCTPSPSTSWANSMDSSGWAAGGMFGAEQKAKVVGGTLPLPKSFSDAPKMGSTAYGPLERVRSLRKAVFAAAADRHLRDAENFFHHRVEQDHCLNYPTSPVLSINSPTN